MRGLFPCLGVLWLAALAGLLVQPARAATPAPPPLAVPAAPTAPAPQETPAAVSEPVLPEPALPEQKEVSFEEVQDKLTASRDLLWRAGDVTLMSDYHKKLQTLLTPPGE